MASTTSLAYLMALTTQAIYTNAAAYGYGGAVGYGSSHGRSQSHHDTHSINSDRYPGNDDFVRRPTHSSRNDNLVWQSNDRDENSRQHGHGGHQSGNWGSGHQSDNWESGRHSSENIERGQQSGYGYGHQSGKSSYGHY
ncbi:hypothetical protein KQX54_015965 [Cotesia glomerata]|uniref:Uncharacterized protein n=1 Tax=Cotesia glomerata TaxID=32391 RepID=A0AAV7HY01_COTGL|nr:hypothetical protein KQX54_015965 [Cotesia glomerata]